MRLMRPITGLLPAQGVLTQPEAGQSAADAWHWPTFAPLALMCSCCVAALSLKVVVLCRGGLASTVARTRVPWVQGHGRSRNTVRTQRGEAQLS